MALDAKLVGSTSGNVAEVDSNNNLKVTLPTTGSQMGLAGVGAVVHDATAANSAAKVTRNGDISQNRRLRVGIDTLWFQDSFSYSAQNSAIWTQVVSTMTITYTSGFVILNGGASTASSAVARFQTYRFFPVQDVTTNVLEFTGLFTQAAQASVVWECGLMQSAGTSAPTDGVFFRINSATSFLGVISYNGVETTVDLSNSGVFLPAASTQYNFKIVTGFELTEFWIQAPGENYKLLGSISTPSGGTGPYLGRYLPLAFRIYNSGTPSLAQQFKLGVVNFTTQDIATNRPWPHTMAGMGYMAYQGQAGQTMGTTAQYANSSTPSAAVPTNTTAALGSGLGGIFAATQSLGVNTDGIISSYQVPGNVLTNPQRTLVITGIKISSIVTTVLAGGPFIFTWSLAFGHTAVSLATTEAATTKAPRRIALGLQVFATNAAVGVRDNDIYMKFDSPIVVQPGEFIQTVCRNIGTVGTSGVVTHAITFDGYFE